VGLDTTHDCWHGAYSAFSQWRKKLCEVAGYGDIREREGFGGAVPWPEDDPLVLLLTHSDCDGELRWQDCGAIARRLAELLPALERVPDEEYGHIRSYTEKTKMFIAGLLDAAGKREDVLFR